MTVKKIFLISIMKVIAILLVVFYHFYYIPIDFLSNNNIEVYFNYFIKTLLSCCVPLFFFVNGALLLNKQGSLDIKKHTRKIFSLILRIFIWSIFVLLFLMPLCEKPLSFKSLLITVISLKSSWINYLWFLKALIVLYIFLPIIKSSYDNHKAAFYFFMYVVFLLTFGSQFISTLINIIGHFTGKERLSVSYNIFGSFNAFSGMYGYSMGYFMLGGVLFCKKELFNQVKFKFMSVIIIPIIMFLHMCYGVIMSKNNGIIYDVVWSGYDSIFTFIIVIAIFIISLSFFKNLHFTNFINIIAENTLGIYLIHIPLEKFLHILFFNIIFKFNFLGNLLYSILIFFLSLLLSLLLKNIPVIKYMFST